MNILSSISPIFPVVSGALPATTSNASSSGSGVASGEGFSTAEGDPTRGVEQSPENRSDNTATDQEQSSSANARGLDEAQLKELANLKARDREVRAHEAAHQAVGGQYAGAMSFTYQRGPDGAQYAVGGEVPIDVSPVAGDPQATIEKMRVVRAAAMAPAQPSAQDRAVAAQAMQTMLQAQSELALGDDVKQASPSESGLANTDQDGQTANGRQANETYRSVFAMQGTALDPATSVFA
ncbi:MAG: SprA-related family [Marinobacter excellens HL-55]|uniref:SprA-related family n=1 Tax=Marinobacter excellens HL-55 TaxID=1305731 RepID=A0A0P8BIN7_9GAMM|nr:MAG: SprA-related family [Marinobacter excellens HL-55]